MGTRNFTRWLSWENWETSKLLRELQRQNQPKGQYQRLPDGTWGYPSPVPDPTQEAFQRGWTQGWEAGYKAAKEKAPA